MQLYRFEDAIAFYDRTQSYLTQHEIQHGVLLGIIKTLIKSPEQQSEAPYLAIVEEEGNIIACCFADSARVAACTPSNRVVLSIIPNLLAVQLIVEDLYTTNKKLRLVSGLSDEAQAFTTAWNLLSGQICRVTLHLRFYRLDTVQPVSGVKGHLRLAEERDRSRLVEWFRAFSEEVDPTHTSGITESAEQRVESKLSQKNLYIWQDKVPVSCIGKGKTELGSGIISPVYTPPEHRKNGYASASVAAVSQILLDQGCRVCYLTTNINNSTSNRIYQNVGYQVLCDWHRYTFE